jgi:hypothetical protein
VVLEEGVVVAAIFQAGTLGDLGTKQWGRICNYCNNIKKRHIKNMDHI